MSPNEAWSSWSVDPLLLVGVAVAGTWYARGVGMLWTRPGRGISRRRVFAFFAGLFVLLLALASPIDAAGDALLVAHMTQHLLLIAVAAPLLALGAPGMVLAQPVPPGVHRTWRRRTGRRWVRSLSFSLGHPLTVWLAAVAALWAWHAPALYDLALRNSWVHRVEHLVFLGTWFLFWRLLLDRGSRRRLARGADVVFVITGGLAAGALGAVLALAPLPLYAAYLTTTAAWGLTPLQDQRLAGLLMWVPTGVESLAIAAWLFVALLRHAERAAQREDEARLRALRARAAVTGDSR